MPHEGFIVDAQQTIENDVSYVTLAGRLFDGTTFITKNRYEHHLFIRSADRARAKTTLSSFSPTHTFHDVSLHDPHGAPIIKIAVSRHTSLTDLRSSLENEGIPTYEADVRFVRRFLIDHGITATLRIEGDHTEQHGRRVFDEPTLTPADDTIPSLLIASIDIETSPDAQQLYSIAISLSDGTDHALIVSSRPVKGAEHHPDEKTLLLRFCEIIRTLDPDIITGWNVIDFDFNVLRDHAKRAGIELNLGRIDRPIDMRIHADFLKTSTVRIPGRCVIDGIDLLKMNFVSMEDYTLQTVSKQVLSESKTITGDRGDEIKNRYEQDPASLITYNVKDARLALRILEKLGLIDVTAQRSIITGLLMDEVRGSIASLDSMYLRELRTRDIVYHTTMHNEREERITGGFVMESSPGIYDNVLVFDFKSLYPSIIATFNIDPLANRDEGEVIAPNGARFLAEPDGILPVLITRLSALRDQAKNEKNDIKSFALKITMNSIFGVLANPNCRFYSLPLANAITHFGQHIIKHTAQKIEEMGYEVIYGDTDSVFVNISREHNPQDAGARIASELNTYYSDHIPATYHRPSRLILQFEKHFSKFWMPTVRGSEEGSKKRYAGLITTPQEKLVIVGLEYVRRDWTLAAREFQYELLMILFHEQDPQAFIRSYIESLRSGAYDEKLMYRKALRKPLSEYTKTTPPHVKAARKLDRIESNIIDYYLTTNGPEPKEKLTSPIDYDHYIDKQIKPLAQAILHTIGLEFDDILKGSAQKNLFDWK